MVVQEVRKLWLLYNSLHVAVHGEPIFIDNSHSLISDAIIPKDGQGFLCSDATLWNNVRPLTYLDLFQCSYSCLFQLLTHSLQILERTHHVKWVDKEPGPAKKTKRPRGPQNSNHLLAIERPKFAAKSESSCMPLTWNEWFLQSKYPADIQALVWIDGK